MLATPRLRLRGHRVEDFSALAALWGDESTTRFIGGKPATETESWARLLRYGGMWPLLGYGYWAIEDRATGAYFGDVGVARFRRGIPEVDDVPEVGWVLAAQARGRGFAGEALAAVLAWADRALDSRETSCMIDPGNVPSLALATRFGFKQVAQVESRGAPSLIFRRTRA